MVIKDVMTGPVVTVEPWTAMRHAATLLHQGGFRHLPVVQDGALVGMISDRDVAEARARGAMQALLTVESFMCRDPVTVRPETPVGEACRLTGERKIGALPVLDGQRLVGIVTRGDLLRMLARAETAESGV